MLEEVGVGFGSSFPFGNGVICRAQLCPGSFLGSSGILAGFNRFEHMLGRWLGVEVGMVGWFF